MNVYFQNLHSPAFIQSGHATNVHKLFQVQCRGHVVLQGWQGPPSVFQPIVAAEWAHVVIILYYYYIYLCFL